MKPPPTVYALLLLLAALVLTPCVGAMAPSPLADADLVLLRDNPLDDIRHTRNIDGVMVRGAGSIAHFSTQDWRGSGNATRHRSPH